MKTKNTATKLDHPWMVGTCYIIRTVTMILTGRLAFVGHQELVLDDAAWIACTKRWADTLSTGEVDEVEPFPGSAIVGRGSIIDAAEWTHALPKVQW